MIIPAYLWDGHSRLSGELVIGDQIIEFKSHDFQTSHLRLTFEISKIKSVVLSKVYSLQLQALIINSINDHVDVFVVNNPLEIRSIIQHKIDKLNKES